MFSSVILRSILISTAIGSVQGYSNASQILRNTVAALGGIDVLRNITSYSFEALTIYRSQTLTQNYGLKRKITEGYRSESIVHTIIDYWIWGYAELTPGMNFSVVVQDGLDGFACFNQGQNSFYVDDPTVALGYADAYLTDYLVQQAHQFTLPWLIKQFIAIESLAVRHLSFATVANIKMSQSTYDSAAHAPEVIKGPSTYYPPEAPQVFYRNEPPEVYEPSSNPKTFPYHEVNPIGLGRKRSILGNKRKRLIFTALVILVVVAIAVGIWLGVSLRKKPLQDSMTFSPPQLVHGIANDSSMGAWIAPDNDKTRHIFFQDINSNIRQAVFDPRTGSWTSTVDNVVATNARENTPMTIGLRENLNDGNVNLFYISANNTVAFTTFANDTWLTSAPVSAGQVPIPVSATGRALSVGIIAEEAICLIYEDPNGTIRAIRANASTTNVTEITVTEDLTQSLTDAASSSVLKPPFSVEWVAINDTATLAINSEAKGDSNLPAQLHLLTFNATTSIEAAYTDIGFLPFSNNEYSVFWLNANDHNLDFASVSSGTSASINGPASPFPFGRLGFMTVGQQQYVLHQIDQTMFAQDIWDTNSQRWVSSTNITVNTGT
ncbi:MAG: hypothetical protein M1820_001847 [Bogoriella megaspora]|nr:MAG: hypothetical protein M1820_001847 [Bogoriella megaspora]